MKRSICSLLVVLGLAVAGSTGNGFAQDTEERNGDLPVKIYFLAGQSNMQGCGDIMNVHTEKPSDWVHSFGMNDLWSIAEEPLHKLYESLDPVHYSRFFGKDLTPEQLAEARSTAVRSG